RPTRAAGAPFRDDNRNRGMATGIVLLRLPDGQSHEAVGPVIADQPTPSIPLKKGEGLTEFCFTLREPPNSSSPLKGEAGWGYGQIARQRPYTLSCHAQMPWPLSFLPRQAIDIGAQLFERFAQFLDHRVGSAEIEILVEIADMALEEV